MRCWLKAMREEKGMSQNCVAERAGISQASYCNIENGERNPAVTTAKKISEVLGFSWTEFYEENTRTEALACQTV